MKAKKNATDEQLKLFDETGKPVWSASDEEPIPFYLTESGYEVTDA